MNRQPLTRLMATLMLALTLFGSQSALALSLDEAKEQGLVGERLNGYLGIVVQPAPPEVVRLITDINQRRQIRYRQIAQDNDTSLANVEKLAGRKAIRRSEPDHFVQTPAGNWVQRRTLSQ